MALEIFKLIGSVFVDTAAADESLQKTDKNAEGVGSKLVSAAASAGKFALGVVGAAAAAGTALVAVAENTREYRTEQGKLQAAFETSGFSAETARATYSALNGVLGDSGQAVEAANHLALLATNEQDLATWTNICTGVYATFGDSLPIEGLTEAANHTAKLGEVQGPLADALEWIGITTEDFNKQLAKCNTEEERATLITETLNNKYQAAADEYNELTKSTQDARRATSDMEDAQADLGATIEPLTTAWTRLKVQALEAILPVVQKVVGAMQDLNKWMAENPQKAEIVKGVLLGIATALGVLAVALSIHTLIGLVTKAFTALNLVMTMNPIGLVVAALAGLVAAFVYLWNNCDAFKEFWIELWDAIKETAAAMAEWFSKTWDATISGIKDAWDAAGKFFADVWDGIKDAFSDCKKWFGKIFSEAWAAVTGVWDAVAGYFHFVWESIKLVFATIGSWFGQKFQEAKSAVTKVWDTVSGYFSGVWTQIKEVFSAVADWFRQKFQDAKNAITNIWDTVAGYFSDVYDNILDVFSDIKDKFFEVGENIIDGIWDGLKDGWDWLKDKVADLAFSLFDSAKEALGIESPSKEFAWIGKMTAQGQGVGYEDEMDAVEKDMKARLADMTTRLQATVAAENARVGQSAGVPDTGFTDLARAVGMQTAGINSLAGEYRRGSSNMRPIILQLDKRELGRAVVDVGGAEESRIGTKLALGGAY